MCNKISDTNLVITLTNAMSCSSLLSEIDSIRSHIYVVTVSETLEADDSAVFSDDNSNF